MSGSARKGTTSKQKSPKIKVLPEEQTNNQFDQLAGNVGTPEDDKYRKMQMNNGRFNLKCKNSDFYLKN